jgi:hypothetical protein
VNSWAIDAVIHLADEQRQKFERLMAMMDAWEAEADAKRATLLAEAEATPQDLLWPDLPARQERNDGSR